MKIAAAVPVLMLLTAAVSRAGEPVVVGYRDSSPPPAFSLFVSCDLTEEFVTPGIDAREVLWMSTPVSREGARMFEESRRACVVARVDSGSRGHIRLLAGVSNEIHEPAKPVAPRPRAGMSTWVRIRGLYGR